MRVKRNKEEIRREQKEKEDKERAEEEDMLKQKEKEEEIRMLEEKSEDTVRGNMVEMEGYLNDIIKAVSTEVGGKIAFNKTELATVKSAALSIKSIFVGYLVKHLEAREESCMWERKCRLLEKKLEEVIIENKQNVRETSEGRQGEQSKDKQNRNVESSSALREKVGGAVGGQEGMNESDVSSEDEVRENVSYSQVLRGRGRGRGGNRGLSRGVSLSNRNTGLKGRTVEGGEGWVTPPRSVEIIVSKAEERNGRRLAEMLANTVEAEKIGGAPKAVKVMRDGKLRIVAKDEEHGNRIVREMVNIEGVDARKMKSIDPMIMITGVDSSILEEELKKQIERNNEGIKEEDMKIIKRFRCRNPWKTNWVVRLPGAKFREIIKKGKINIGCESLFVEEYVGVLMCFRCCRYGHLSTRCMEPEVCYNCGREHGGGSCTERELRCINCWRAYGREEGHGARSQECPVYKINMEKARRATDYNRINNV